jgi:uncharacterized membrane protein YbaN (DUF454 family)
MTEPPVHPAPTAAPAPRLPRPARWLLMGLAVASLVLGIIGIFVPVLPTVPFVLLAAWAAGLSSPRLLAWLEGHRRFGPMLVDWRRGGVVGRRAKWAATLTMSGSALIMLWTMPQRWMALLAIACMACVLGWLWQRPEAMPPE